MGLSDSEKAEAKDAFAEFGGDSGTMAKDKVMGCLEMLGEAPMDDDFKKMTAGKDSFDVRHAQQLGSPRRSP